MPCHVQAWRRAARSDVPSILLHGPAGIGERDFALALAAHWLCEGSPNAAARPCLACASCKLIEAGNHPDLRVIEPASMAAESEDADGDEETVEDKGKGKGSSKGKGRSTAARARRPVPYPTLRRSLIRAPIFGLMWFVISRFLLSGGERTINADILQAAILTAAMLPLLYFADKVTYTLAKRRDQPVAEPGPDGWLGFKR